jgi:sugar lactone lactonase YvrE
MVPRIATFFALALGGAQAGNAPPPDLVFAAGAEWELVSEGHDFAEGMAWDAAGHFYFSDVFYFKNTPPGQIFRIDRNTGVRTLLDGATGQANGIAFGPDGRLYGCGSTDRCIYAWDPATWQKTKVAEGTESNDMVMLRDGTVFYTEPPTRSVWRLAPRTFERTLAARLDWGPNGISVSRDEKTLLVAEFASDRIHGFALDDSRKVAGPDRIAYRVTVPSNGRGSLDGMVVLPDGRLLVGTNIGIQIVPPIDSANGSLSQILIPIPENRRRCNYVRVSPDGEWLYAAFAADILRRRLRPGFAQP